MYLTQLEQQKIDALTPSKLEFGKILLNRYRNLPKLKANEVKKARKGEEGELQAIKFLKEFGKEHWIYFRNVWQDYKGRYESDLIAITNAAIYVQEIKNYDGLFTYENGICTIDDYEPFENCIAQAQRAHKKVDALCRETSIRTNVHGVIVFIGDHNPVEIKSPVSNIEVVPRSYFKKYIQRMVADERNHYERSINVERFIQGLNKYSIPDPFRFEPLTDEEFKNIRTGICCARCQSFDLQFNRKYTNCSCGFKELRIESIIRTICEYGVLKYDSNLTHPELFNFFGGNISKTSLYNTLNEHFEKVSPNTRLGYVNKKLPFEIIAKEFNLV